MHTLHHLRKRRSSEKKSSRNKHLQEFLSNHFTVQLISQAGHKSFPRPNWCVHPMSKLFPLNYSHQRLSSAACSSLRNKSIHIFSDVKLSQLWILQSKCPQFFIFTSQIAGTTYYIQQMLVSAELSPTFGPSCLNFGVQNPTKSWGLLHSLYRDLAQSFRSFTCTKQKGIPPVYLTHNKNFIKNSNMFEWLFLHSTVKFKAILPLVSSILHSLLPTVFLMHVGNASLQGLEKFWLPVSEK